MRKRSWVDIGRRSVSFVMAAVLALSLAGCKPTDFFVEKIITPQAEQEDTNNENVILINSLDATQESKTLAALDWADESFRTEDVENLVVWSEEPNTTMTTHHSIFDLKPRIAGILASDGVKVNFNEDADDLSDTNNSVQTDKTASSHGKGSSGDNRASSATDTDADDSDETAQDLNADGEGGDGNASDQNAAGSGNTDGEGGDGGDGSGKASGEDGDGDNDDGTGGGGSGDDDDDGKKVTPEGENGDVDIVDPLSPQTKLPKADRVAVIGKQAAVMVEAIGGENAICAMSTYDYKLQDDGASYTFESVFENRMVDDDHSVYFWGAANAESESDALSSMNLTKLIESFGDSDNGTYKGVIFYDSKVVNGTSLRNAIASAMEGIPAESKRDITCVALSFEGTSADNIIENYTQDADAIKQVLSETKTADASAINDRASDYEDILGYASKAASSSTSNVRICVATEVSPNNTLTNQGDSTRVASDQIFLFRDLFQSQYKPLNTWIKAAGFTIDEGTGTAEYGIGALALLIPDGIDSSDREGKPVDFYQPSQTVKGWEYGLSQSYDEMADRIGSTDTPGQNGGLGSVYLPYLIVNGGTSGWSSTQVETEVEKAIESAGSTNPSLYAAFGSRGAIPDNFIITTSNIGRLSSGTGGKDLGTNEDVEDTVWANPGGVLGDWTKSNFESVLEAVWLNALYADSRMGNGDNGFTEDVADVLGVKLSGENMDQAKEVITQFYREFYGDMYAPVYGDENEDEE